MPFKEVVIPLIDSLDESAASIQAVNTIVNTDGHLRGYNTDMQAVAQLLTANDITPNHRVAVIGSGGMAKACVAAVKSLGVTDSIIVARNGARGKELADSYGYHHVLEVEKADVIINATPIGMAGGEASSLLPVSERVVRNSVLVLECVAVPSETPLISLAESAGVRTVRGTQIMTLQAVEQFKLYTGITPSEELVEAAAQFSRKESS